MASLAGVHRLVAGVIMLALAASAASAATIRGTARAERLAGTAAADSITGGSGNDVLLGRGGADFLDGERGRDTVDAGPDSDRLSLETDATRDFARCGPGRDIVTLDELDVAARDCEVVTRRLARDPFVGGDGQHATIAEPDSHAVGATVVSVFQVGRRHDGGAMDIGFATSRDGGTTWRQGRLPGVGANSQPAGRAQRVSDPVVTHDPVHGVWLAATLAVSQGLTELLISRSVDGLAWEPPVVAASSTAAELAYDKNWIACDAWPASPNAGRCYLSYTLLVPQRRMVTQVTLDGGTSWGPAVAVPPSAAGGGVGVLPLPRPDGSLVLVFLDNRGLVASRSADGGQSFSQPVLVGEVAARRVSELRAHPLPAADVGQDGTVYAVWHACVDPDACAANDLLLATSRDGASWTAPRRLAVGPPSAGEPFMPAIAVLGSGGSARVSLAYYVLLDPDCVPAACRVEARYADSRDGGRSWRTRGLVSRPMRLTWIATTTQGRMLADYISITLARGRALPVLAISSPPQAGRLRQAVFAATRVG